MSYSYPHADYHCAKSFSPQFQNFGISPYRSPPTTDSSDLTTASNNLQYDLKVVQQPVHARMCGFGEKDRRSVDPPPVVELTLKEVNGELVDPSLYPESCFLVMHVALWTVATTEEDSQPSSRSSSDSAPTSDWSARANDPVPTISRHVRAGSTFAGYMNAPTLLGGVVASCSILTDTTGRLGFYFVFSDLSVRVEGEFQLKFTLYQLGRESPQQPPSESSTTAPVFGKACSSTFSQSFKVYTPKAFPGMRESTPLTRCFAKQGVKLLIRKEARASRSKASNVDELSND